MASFEGRVRFWVSVYTLVTVVFFVYLGKFLYHKKDEYRSKLKKMPRCSHYVIKTAEYLDHERRPYGSCWKYLKENHILLNVCYGDVKVRSRNYRFLILVAHAIVLLSISMHLRVVGPDNTANEKGLSGIIILISAIMYAFSFTRWIKYSLRDGSARAGKRAGVFLMFYACITFAVSFYISQKSDGDFTKAPGAFIGAELAEWVSEFLELIIFYTVAGCVYASVDPKCKVPPKSSQSSPLDDTHPRSDTFQGRTTSFVVEDNTGKRTFSTTVDEQQSRSNTFSVVDTTGKRTFSTVGANDQAKEPNTPTDEENP